MSLIPLILAAKPDFDDNEAYNFVWGNLYGQMLNEKLLGRLIIDANEDAWLGVNGCGNLWFLHWDHDRCEEDLALVFQLSI